MAVKLWQTNAKLDDQIERFTIGQDQELDRLLAPYDALGSLAHCRMLSEVGLLTAEEGQVLAAGLRDILAEMAAGEFRIEAGVEDVHSQVEYLLTQRLGEVGKKIHTGRSRNDQVLVDLRLFLREELAQIWHGTADLVETLLGQSEQYRDYLLPGYTHLQIGMVSSAGLWFGAYAESLIDDLQLWRSVHDIVNQNPLGSAAGYGSSFPIDRQRTTELLGFSDLNYNSMHAQLGRGKTELYFAFGLAALGATIGKLAMDICLYNGQNYGFFELPRAFTTGSSIMPHKKNPDVVELIRARCNQWQNLPAAVMALTTNLPGGYHRDFQLLKEVLFPAIQQAGEVLELTQRLVSELRVAPDLLADPRYDVLYSVDAINQLVVAGVPFREAYHRVSGQVEAGSFQRPAELPYTHLGSIGELGTAGIRRKLDRLRGEVDFGGWRACLAGLGVVQPKPE
ncbi:MAG: argininosuccinate lyase [Bacteroidota bacterium]